MSPSTPLLDFSTLEPERPKVRIDGELYELTLLSDFGLIAQSRIARLMTEASAIEKEVGERPPPEPTGNAKADAALAALDAVSEDEAHRVVALLDEVVGLILRAPEEVREKLSEVQQRQLIEAFMPAVTAATPSSKASRNQPPARTTGRSTSGPSSRTSRRRTASVPG
jgi:hypothetical protein